MHDRHGVLAGLGLDRDGKQMAGMNANIPPLHCYVRSEFTTGGPGMEEGYAFGVASIKGRGLGFHVMLASGAHFRHIPLHALCTKLDAPAKPLSGLALWDCFSSRIEIAVFEYLRDHEAWVYLPDEKRSGVYLWTVDWLPDSPENPGFTLTPDQNKCGHVLLLDDGNLCMMPTNRIAWRDGYWIGKNPTAKDRGYRTQTDIYQAESCERDFSKGEYFY